MPKPFRIGPRWFKTKKELEADVSKLLYIERQLPFQITGEPFDFLLALFMLHPFALGEKHVDLTHEIWVCENEVQTGYQGKTAKSRGYWIKRLDGTWTDIGKRHCLANLTEKSRNSLQRTNCLLTMRRTIDPQIKEYSNRYYTIEETEKYDVHHVPPFLHIAETFLQEQGITWDQIQLLSKDGQLGSKLPPDLELAWIAYHRTHATYQLLPRSVHQRLPK